MSKEIRASIDEALGFEAVLINSALVSAQNRQRLYWVGKRNADGTYSKVNVEQPEDRGILLKDVLDSAVAMREKGHAVIASAGRTTEREYFIKNQGNMAAEPINVTADGKSQIVKANYHKMSDANFFNGDGGMRFAASGVAEPITDICQVGAMPMPNGELSTSAGFRIYSTEAKGRYLFANGGGAGAKTGLYAVPYEIEFDEDGNPIKAIGKDGKQITIYEVSNGQITIKGKQYPIKLRDGYYIIRKLTVSECKRLQTVPEWYDFCWVETSEQIFGEGVKICKNAKLKDAINLLQTEKLNYAINTTCGSLETEQQNLVENLSITKTNAKPKGATDNSRHLKVTALCTTSVGNDNSRLTNQKSALFVTNQSGATVATECVLGITLNGCYTETLYLTKNENMNLMEILGVNTTKHLTESGFIELLQKKCLEESSNQKKLFIISTLINWIIAKQTYMSATTKPIFISIDSLSDWQHHSLKMELSSLKMGNIGGVSNSAAYKMLGNGWTCEVITHLIVSCLNEKETDFYEQCRLF